jgi:hypothetical protein
LKADSRLTAFKSQQEK